MRSPQQVKAFKLPPAVPLLCPRSFYLFRPCCSVTWSSFVLSLTADLAPEFCSVHSSGLFPMLPSHTRAYISDQSLIQGGARCLRPLSVPVAVLVGPCLCKPSWDRHLIPLLSSQLLHPVCVRIRIRVLSYGTISPPPLSPLLCGYL